MQFVAYATLFGGSLGLMGYTVKNYGDKSFEHGKSVGAREENERVWNHVCRNAGKFAQGKSSKDEFLREVTDVDFWTQHKFNYCNCGRKIRKRRVYMQHK